MKSVRTITSVVEEELEPRSGVKLYAYGSHAIARVCGVHEKTVRNDQLAGKVDMTSLTSVVSYIANRNSSIVISPP